MSLQQQAYQLFENQMSKWPLAAKNFADLRHVLVRTFDFDGFAVKVQCNPARMVSSGAKTDAKTIAERPCFLCAANRPAEQEAVPCGDYELLVNPFPIFPHHFTIPRRAHVAQQIEPYFADLLHFAKELPDFAVFYNGPRCGASAPDHMHFQAGTKTFLPLIDDYERLRQQRTELVDAVGSANIFALKNYLRTLFCIEGTHTDDLQIAFRQLYNRWATEPLVEPMMNIVADYAAHRGWRIFVMPRAAFRPWQYTAENAQQLLISPAAVEMAGVFITPIRTHFDRITPADVKDIFAQVGCE